MIPRHRILAIAVAFPLIVLGPRASEAAPTSSVSGSITNGTAGASLPPQLAVTVVQLGDGGGEVVRKQTNSGADGKFRVEGFDPAAGRRLVVATDYQGVTYSRTAEFPEGSSDATADLKIFESTDDDSAIRIPSDVITIIEGTENNLEIIQLLRITNSSDRTFVGTNESGARRVLGLPVPPGATDLLALEGFRGEATSPIAGGIVTSDPILPGDSSISYLYRVKVARSGWSLRRAIFYPTQRIDLLVETMLEVSAPGFRFEEQVTLEEKTYRRYRGRSLRVGSDLEAEIRPASAPGSNLWWGLGGGLGALAILFLAGVFFARKRKPPRATSPGERERLVEEIAALDEAFVAGQVPEDEYRRRRNEMKTQLQLLSERPAPALK